VKRITYPDLVPMTVGFTELFIMLAVLLLAGCVQPFKMYSTSHSCGNTPLGHTVR
jgi:hypothetical protein